MSSTPRRNAALAEPWLPMRVGSLHLAATSRTTRASWTQPVSGFSQKTGLPAFSTATVMTACRWSGVATMTPSICLCISSSNLRKSWNLGTFGSAW